MKKVILKGFSYFYLRSFKMLYQKGYRSYSFKDYIRVYSSNMKKAIPKGLSYSYLSPLKSDTKKVIDPIFSRIITLLRLNMSLIYIFKKDNKAKIYYDLKKSF